MCLYAYNVWARVYVGVALWVQTPYERFTVRPSHLQIPGGPRMARAALGRQAIDGPCAVM